MTWKDTLRKAPFDTSVAQMDRNAEIRQERQKVLKDFPKLLERFIDERLRKKINNDPSADNHFLEMNDEFARIVNGHLQKYGDDMKAELEKLMEDAYNVQDVMIDNKIQRFRGIGKA